MKTVTVLFYFMLSFFSYGQIKTKNVNNVNDNDPSGRGQLDQNGHRTGIWEF
jgi:hypothetical protein